MASKKENIVEGYDERRFEGQVKPDLLCSICHNVLREPKTCENKEHPFCFVCITRHLRNSSTCPECREYLTPQTLKRPARFFMNCLSELKISCDYKDQGCPEYVPLGNLKSHVDQCEFAPESGDAECEMNGSHEFRIHKCHDCRDIKASQDEIKAGQDGINVQITETKVQITRIETKLDEINEKVNVEEKKQIQTDTKARQEKIKVELDGTRVQIAAIERKQDQINERVDQIKANVDVVRKIQEEMKADQARFKEELREQFESMMAMMNRITQRNNVNAATAAVAGGKPNECKQQ